MTVNDLVAYRDVLFAEYDRVKDQPKKANSLAFQIASISESIAEEYVKTGERTTATLSYLIQGEYLFTLGRNQEGFTAWQKAKDTTDNEKLKSWIEDNLKNGLIGPTNV